MIRSFLWQRRLPLGVLGIALLVLMSRRNTAGSWRRYLYELIWRLTHPRRSKDDEKEDELGIGGPPECRPIRTVTGLLTWVEPGRACTMGQCTALSASQSALQPAAAGLLTTAQGTLRHRSFCQAQAVSLMYHATGAGTKAEGGGPEASLQTATDVHSTALLPTATQLPAKPAPLPRPKLLVCHDMKGGYLGDRWVQATDDPAQFSLWQWQCVDTLVYFSHHMVTIPPPAWIAAAHRNGVQVLGTLITEWARGRARCERLFATRMSAQRVAEQLALIAAHHGFDGWLVNIENGLPTQLLPNLLHFLSHLRARMRALRGAQSAVIWYDALTTKGSLEWQNNLTPLNAPFFDACDALFVNYTWHASSPAAVAAAAGSRAADVYMGVDVFGRGTYGGGQLICGDALRVARAAGVSAALFAPGWTFEAFERDGFEERADVFWDSLASEWQPRPAAAVPPLCTLPLVSSFCRGQGTHGVWVAGVQVHDTPWSQLAAQQLQPYTGPMQLCCAAATPVPAAAIGSSAQSSEATGGSANAVVVDAALDGQRGGHDAAVTLGQAADHTASTAPLPVAGVSSWCVTSEPSIAFSGASCLRVQGSHTELFAAPVHHRLLTTHIPVPAHGLLVTYAAAPLSLAGLATECSCAVVLWLISRTHRATGTEPPPCTGSLLTPTEWRAVLLPAAGCPSTSTSAAAGRHLPSGAHEDPGTGAVGQQGGSSGGNSDGGGPVSGEWAMMDLTPLWPPSHPHSPPVSHMHPWAVSALAMGQPSHSGQHAHGVLQAAGLACFDVPAGNVRCTRNGLLGCASGSEGASLQQRQATDEEGGWVVTQLRVEPGVLPPGTLITGVGLVVWASGKADDVAVTGVTGVTGFLLGHLALQELPPGHAHPPSTVPLAGLQSQQVDARASMGTGLAQDQVSATSQAYAFDLTWAPSVDAAGLPLYSSYHVWARPAGQAPSDATPCITSAAAQDGAGASAANDEAEVQHDVHRANETMPAAADAEPPSPRPEPWAWLGQCFTERFYAKLDDESAGSSWELAVQPVTVRDGLPSHAVSACSSLVVRAARPASCPSTNF